MSKTYRPYDPDQQLLLPAALQEWLPPDHLAYFISEGPATLGVAAGGVVAAGELAAVGPPEGPVVVREFRRRAWSSP